MLYRSHTLSVFLFFTDAATTEIYTDLHTLSLHDALPICGADIVGYEDYADKSIVSLRDTLAFSPGVYLQPRFGQEVRISIRGSGLSRGYHMRGLTLLQDGVPINLADDNGDFQELETIFFDHLEVYRGANALRSGPGTLGGAITGVTPTRRTARGAYPRADGGSFESLRKSEEHTSELQ